MSSLVFVLLLSMSTARAESDVADSGSEPSMVTTVRLVPPASSWLLGMQRHGSWNVGGLSVSGRFARLVEIETGYEFRMDPCYRADHWIVRGGVTGRIGGSQRWDVRAVILAAYRYITATGGGCDYSPDGRAHVLMVDAGLAATYWPSAHVGIDLRWLAGSGFWGWSEFTGYAADPKTSGRAAEVSLSFGLSIR